jgi:hypothetical protein
MEILETKHAYLTGYEVSRILSKRIREERVYKDSRDQKYLSSYEDVDAFRKNLFISLDENSPEPLPNESDIDIGQRIYNFSVEIQKEIPGISPQKIRDLIAYRPNNESQVNAIFSTQEEWDFLESREKKIIELVQKYIPRVERITEDNKQEEEKEEETKQPAAEEKTEQ